MGGSLTYVTQIPIRSSFDIDRVRQQVLQAQNLSAAHWSAGQRACRPKQEVGDGTLEDVSHLHILSATKAFTLRAGLGTRLDAVLASALAVGLPSAARAPSAESAVCLRAWSVLRHTQKPTGADLGDNDIIARAIGERDPQVAVEIGLPFWGSCRKDRTNVTDLVDQRLGAVINFALNRLVGRLGVLGRRAKATRLVRRLHTPRSRPRFAIRSRTFEPSCSR
jgi:hypothetical protein